MRRLAALMFAAALAGCATGPAPRMAGLPGTPVAGEVGARVTPGTMPGTDLTAPLLPSSPLGAKAAEAARSLVGTPYRYGGRDPRGFDCSGLVWYVYQGLGIELPRRSREQRQTLSAVGRDALEPGDLVFFSSPVDHVGIYLGGGDFVHAPRRGKRVSVARLDSPYFQLGYAGAARVLMP